MNSCNTADIAKIIADAEALYDLFNIFGRGRVTEETWVAMYLSDKLPEFIKKVCEEGEKK